MATRRRSPAKKLSTPRASSWLALLAATTIGVDDAKTVRAEVRAEEDFAVAESGHYRLVVQSYDAPSSKLPHAEARPVGSYQRAVTAAELRRGVHVNLLELRQVTTGNDSGSLLAWIEAGKPDLEFDGRAARPQPGSVFGLARRGTGASAVQIRLSRKAA